MQKISRKKEIKKAADAEMSDATKPGPAMQSIIASTVSAEVKKALVSIPEFLQGSSTNKPRLGLSYQGTRGKSGEQSQRGDRRTPSTSSRDSFNLLQADQVSAEEGDQGCQGQSRSGRQERRRSRLQEGRRPQDRRPKGDLQQGRLQEVRQSSRQDEAEQRLGGPPSGAVASDLASAFMADLHARYDIPSSYPDWILTIPFPTAVRLIILCTPVNIVLASQYKDSIHTSPGVEIPRELQQDLSVGMRYMLYSPRNSKLIKEAWDDFERRLRWRVAFAFKGEDNSLYDPDYEVASNKTKKAPPQLPFYLELGIRRGRDFVKKTILKIPDEETDAIKKSLTPQSGRLRRFLLENDLVVTNTDKNLGIAVSKRQWINEKCLELLHDTSNYELLPTLMISAYIKQQNESAETVAALAESHLENGEQIAQFLRSCLSPVVSHKGVKTIDYKRCVPLFYGIPKIHKEPVKMRPIIPCHSAVQNPAAKFVSKKLKPLIMAAPTVIHGTKDLAVKLSKLELTKGRQFFIVTGDVVAFYPNIPIQHCLDIVSTLYAEEYMDGTTQDDPEKYAMMLREAEVFHKCLHLGNLNLITRYGDEYFRQKRGLAMGVADSPDLANLYGWYFERKANILLHPSVPYYGRYIDDCLAIVYASSPAEAVHIVSSAIKFDECVIEWDAGTYAPFLDMQLYIDEFNDIQHMPYRKSRSHQERIPWISHHPLDVKRGTFIGEMSRLATLSSEFVHYRDALSSLAGLYITRGYPQDLVYKWMRDNIAKRWENRLNIIEREHEQVLVLKSTFNTAWNYFSAKELGDTVLGYWNDYLSHSEDNADPATFPKFTPGIDTAIECRAELTTRVLMGDGSFQMIPDIRKTDIFNRRTIVSRKRTRNLFDLTSLWKKTVLQKYEIDASNPLAPNDDDAASSSDSIWQSEPDLDPRHDPSSLEFVAGPSFYFEDMQY